MHERQYNQKNEFETLYGADDYESDQEEIYQSFAQINKKNEKTKAALFQQTQAISDLKMTTLERKINFLSDSLKKIDDKIEDQFDTSQHANLDTIEQPKTDFLVSLLKEKNEKDIKVYHEIMAQLEQLRNRNEALDCQQYQKFDEYDIAINQMRDKLKELTPEQFSKSTSMDQTQQNIDQLKHTQHQETQALNQQIQQIQDQIKQMHSPQKEEITGKTPSSSPDIKQLSERLDQLNEQLSAQTQNNQNLILEKIEQIHNEKANSPPNQTERLQKSSQEHQALKKQQRQHTIIAEQLDNLTHKFNFFKKAALAILLMIFIAGFSITYLFSIKNDTAQINQTASKKIPPIAPQELFKDQLKPSVTKHPDNLKHNDQSNLMESKAVISAKSPLLTSPPTPQNNIQTRPTYTTEYEETTNLTKSTRPDIDFSSSSKTPPNDLMQSLTANETQTTDIAKTTTKTMPDQLASNKTPLPTNAQTTTIKKTETPPSPIANTELTFNSEVKPISESVTKRKPIKTDSTLIAYQTNNKILYNQEYLLQMNPDDFTLQLLGSRNVQDIFNYIQQQSRIGETAMFKTTHKGNDWYVLVQGEFKSVQNAIQAIAILPENIQSKQPWVRKLSQVQKLIQKTKIIH